MLGELGPVWPSTWAEIWLPLLRHREFGDDLARDLFREHVTEPRSLKPTTELSESELSELQAAIGAHEEAAASAPKAKAALRQKWFRKPKPEIAANRVDSFLKRYSLRYDLRRPLTLHPTLAGIFASLVKELRSISLRDAHLQALLSEFEEALRDLKTDLTQTRIKTCLQKQFNLLEAVGSTFPGVTQQTLGDMAGQINSWPHATIRESLKRLYGFRSDYPGLGHAGNPAGVLRELDARDVVAIGVMLAGFVPYLSDQLDSRIVYGA
jgi:hypothetical protein